MREHHPEVDGPAEEWQTASMLYTNPIGGVVLCRFTGERVGEKFPECQRRGVTHPDVDCFEIFWSATAIGSGMVNQELVASEVRIGGQDLLFVHPVGTE